ncbi:hypothetical protein G3M81_12355 [Bacillus paralicheniformis]|uniref:hypothetical protein n=1 Tax=Bacillus TaxID=1386 RepID=UPI0013EEEEE1|nr:MULTISPECIES: hypothetical protein [Bacillus]MCY8609895.1 hypothetical protein [Bacillus haynesii]MEC0752127.1 hypothetical protein [Bacillus haynesii]QII49483.1 hypothetical protein G3M81_12355 [Bacillus paralicheniformis]
MEGNVRVEDYVSKSTIQKLLENYAELAAGDRPDDVVSTGGPKAYDGVSATQLNKIMLDHAIEKLPADIRSCVKSRYVYKLPVSLATDTLGISRKMYYTSCRRAIDMIYKDLNGKSANAKALLEKIIN